MYHEGMGTTTATNLLTFEEFERLPDQPGKRELLEGELIELPPAEYTHNDVAERICDALKTALAAAHARGEATELSRAHHEMGYELPDAGWLQPDVSVTHTGQKIAKYAHGAPAIAIEVISPSNKAQDMETKVSLYFRHGAREVWHVYLRTRHIIVHLGGTSRTVREQDVLTTPLLPGFTLRPAEMLTASSADQVSTPHPQQQI